MSWVSTEEIHEGRTLKIGEDGHRTYTRVWQVRFNNPYDGPLMARAAVPIAFKAMYQTDTEFDSKARVVGIDVSNGESLGSAGVIYKVNVTYSTNTSEYENPLDEPPEITWKFASVPRILEKDRDNKAAVNGAGDPFDIVPTVEGRYRVITVVRNVLTHNRTLADDLIMKTNNGTWNDYPADTVLCTNYEGVPADAMVGDQKLEYYVETIEFAVDKAKKWYLDILNVGMRCLVGGVKQKCLTHVVGAVRSGDEVDSPVKLALDGTQIAHNAAATYITLKPYTQADFSQFGITLPS